MIAKKQFPIVLVSLFGLDFGVRYISSFLKENGYPSYIISFNQLRYTVELMDNNYFIAPLLKHNPCPEEDLRQLMVLLKRLEPKIIGISVSSVTMQSAQRITSEIKKNFDTLVIWGGIHAIIAPEECSQYADIVCAGEGELPMLELADRIRENQSIADIRNLWVRTGREVKKNELRPLIENLDTLQFPDFIEGDNKFLIDSGRIMEDPHIISSNRKNIYPIMSSRGCLFNCSFCSNSIIRERYKDSGVYLRRRSVQNVIAELELVIRNRPISQVQFWDDLFTYDKDWVEEFCNVYLSRIGKPFTCYVHPSYTDVAILRTLANAGLFQAWMGIQSGSESVSKNIFGRNQSVHDVLDLAKRIKELHIAVRYDLISDNPYETDDDQRRTVDFLLGLPRPSHIVIYSLCYFPGTPLTKKLLNDGLITTQDLEQYSSKALNNFHMHPLLSPNKKQFFWNCIKAMVVNRHFPKFIVRLCKRISFLQKHPKLLFFLGRNYLRLFKPIGKEKPFISGNSIFTLKNPESFITFGKSNFLFISEKLIFLLFPADNNGSFKRFCLRIKNGLEKNLSFKLFVEISLFDTGTRSKKNIWDKVKIEIKPNSVTDAYFDLFYPDLYLTVNGYNQRLKMIKTAKFKRGESKLYVIKISIRFYNKLGYKQVGYIICEI